MHKSGFITVGIILAACAAAQVPPTPAFEVASVKPAQDMMAQFSAGNMHIGMTVDAARVDIGSISLAELIPMAFRLKPYQVKGPDWLSTNRFDIVAKIPDGVSKEKVPEMLQALLTERFGLTFHRENKDLAVYALIEGKDGSKLTPADPDPPGTPPADPAASGGFMFGGPPGTGGPRPSSIQLGGGGRGGGGRAMMVSTPESGSTRMTTGPDGNMHMEAARVSMTGFADMISRFVDRPVIDSTGLKGFYKITLDLAMGDLMRVAQSWGMMPRGGLPPGMMPGGRGGAPSSDTASDPSGAAIFASVQKLGLKLDGRKAPIESIVIDHVEKLPTEN